MAHHTAVTTAFTTAVPPGLAGIAALIGDPARACMVSALMDGRALTASELAMDAGVAPPTASAHLARLVEGGLLAVERQGRHRYHRLASPLVGRMIEGILAVAEPLGQTGSAAGVRRRATPRVPAPLRAARTCYDHLAGRLGVAIADGLLARGHVRLDEDGGEVTTAGLAALQAAGIPLRSAPRAGRPLGRPFCRPCLDWTERRRHLAGQVGAAICAHAFERGWITRLPGTRAVAVTPAGARGFAAAFGVDPRIVAGPPLT
jgi:DNA-binding transcriptional ArsR family regulator